MRPRPSHNRNRNRAISDATATLLARPWRTLATALGVIIGIASGMFTMMLTASEHGQVDRNFDNQLAQLVVIEADPAPDGTSKLSPVPDQALTQIAKAPATSTGGELSTWQRNAQITTSRHRDPTTAPIFGASPGGLTAAGVTTRSGADPTHTSLNNQPLAWIGTDLAADLGIDLSDPNGQIILVNGRRLTVAGTTTPGTRYPALGRAVILAAPAANQLWGPPEQARIIAAVRRGAASVAADHLLAALDPTHTIGVRNATPPDGHLTRRSVNNDVQRAGTILTSIALAFGVISVATALSNSVLQRSTELGLRSALGWTTGRIARLILTEATLLGTYAAALGAALGSITGWAITRHNGWQPILAPAALWLPPLAGLAAGALGGLLPAIRAARIPPTEALRS